MRAVVDTNILLPSIRRGSQLRWLFDALIEGDFILIASTAILLEYEEVIGKRTTAEVARNVMGALSALPNLEQAEPQFRWRLIAADPDDDKFVDAYLAGGADVLVTHDTHFGVLAGLDFPLVTVLSVEAFCAELQQAG